MLKTKKRKNNLNLKLIKIGLSLTIAIVVLFSVGYIYFNYFSWKVYKNNFYDFQITIPSDWTIKEVPINGFNNGLFYLSSPDKNIQIDNDSKFIAWREIDTLKNKISLKTENTDVVARIFAHCLQYCESPLILDIDFYKVFPSNHQDWFVRIDKNVSSSMPVLQKIFNTVKFVRREDYKLDDVITYQTPFGWNKTIGKGLLSYYRSSNDLIFKSPDFYAPKYQGDKRTGSQISVGYALNNKSSENVGLINKTKEKIGDREWDVSFNCYEGCYEQYSMPNGKYNLTVTFNYNHFPRPINKSEYDLNPYSKTLKEFLASIKFKSL